MAVSILVKPLVTLTSSLRLLLFSLLERLRFSARSLSASSVDSMTSASESDWPEGGREGESGEGGVLTCEL